MASETTVLRPHVLQWLKPLHGVAVENGDINPGCPDVNYADGWIELKHLDNWPKVSDGAVVRCEHFTVQQRLWALQRRCAGGQVWFFIQIGRDFLLFDALDAAMKVGFVSRAQLYNAAKANWNKRVNEEEFRICVSQSQRNCYASDEGLVKLKRQLLSVMRSQSAGT